MAIPSGSGTEVLKRVTIHGANNEWTTPLSGTANHIYTIISIIFCNLTNASAGLAMKVNDGSNDVFLLSDGAQKIGAYDTFIFNDKFILEGDDDLKCYSEHTNGDWYITYIDQDWT